MSRMAIFKGVTEAEIEEVEKENGNVGQLMQQRQEGIDKIESICNFHGWNSMHTRGTFLFNYAANEKEIENEIFNVMHQYRLMSVTQL